MPRRGISLESNFDVVICGGGMAGLSMARQLNLELPGLSVLVIDREARPLPEAAWKIGEATTEFGAHYLTEYLQLSDYFTKEHVRKLGFRHFMGDPHGPFEDRPELGLTEVAPVAAFQIDRGKMENDLRELIVKDGATLVEGAQITDIQLNSGDNQNEVSYLDPESGANKTVTCNWVIDGTGRRQFIQRKLGLRRPHRGDPHSAAWFRLRGRVDVEDLVSESNREWHDRVPGKVRYKSTNHICGSGYWIWLIPLSSGITSVGLVTAERQHPFDEYSTFERTQSWLKKNEPAIAGLIEGHELLDFRVMKQYSYSSGRAFSMDRWACVGEAAVFADPYYSPGADLIAMSNTMAIDLIKSDLNGELDASVVDEYSQYLIMFSNMLGRAIQRGYKYLGDETIMAARGVWDSTAAWAYQCPQIFSRIFVDKAKREAVSKATPHSFILLTNRMQKLLKDWFNARQEGRGNLTFEFFDYLGIPWVSDLRILNLRKIDDVDELATQFSDNMVAFQELAQAIFLLAVEDVYPEHLAQLSEIEWMNAWKLTLDPNEWETSGMFSPITDPGDFRTVHSQMRTLFVTKPAAVTAAT